MAKCDTVAIVVNITHPVSSAITLVFETELKMPYCRITQIVMEFMEEIYARLNKLVAERLQ